MIALTAVLLAQVGVATRAWRPAERVVITDYSVVQALAVTPFTLFSITTGGLAIYDLAARRMQPPVGPAEGFPTARVAAALAAPGHETLWLGTTRGWARFDPTTRRWDDGVVAGGVQALAIDPRDPGGGVYLRSGRRWMLLPPGGITPVPGPAPPADALTPLSVEEALQGSPAVDAMRARLLTDDRLRQYRFTAAARTPNRDELFLGTNGGGVLIVDLSFFGVEQLRFGLPAPGAAAVAPGPGGVWVLAGGARTLRRAFVWVDEDLRQFRWVEGGRPELRFTRSHAMVRLGPIVWAGTDQGLLRLDTDREDVTVVSERHSLPGSEVLALASSNRGVVVGTSRGLAVVPDDGVPVRLGTTAGEPALALLAVDDTIWVGLPRGLGLVVPGDERVLVAPGVRDRPALAAPVVALARVGDTIVAATRQALFWRDPVAGTWSAVPVAPPLSAITHVVGDQRGLWVAGPDGVAFGEFAEGRWERLGVPGDVPARPDGLAVQGDWVWIATEQGLVRIRREVVTGS